MGQFSIHLKRLIPVLAVFGVWEGLARAVLVNPLLMPPPSQVVLTIFEMTLSGALPTDLAHSILRVLTGFLLAVILGTPLGFFLSLNRRAATAIEPVIHFLRPIPPIAWIPLAILWFGIGNGPAYFLTMMAAIFPIVLNVQLGASSVSRQHLDLARGLNASRALVFRRIIWPATLPYAISGYRIGLGVAWMTVVGAEMIAARSGLGYLIHSSQDLIRTDRVMAGMAAIGAAGLLIDMALRALERRITPWAVR